MIAAVQTSASIMKGIIAHSNKCIQKWGPRTGIADAKSIRLIQVRVKVGSAKTTTKVPNWKTFYFNHYVFKKGMAVPDS
jgi:hypothetical protein